MKERTMWGTNHWIEWDGFLLHWEVLVLGATFLIVKNVQSVLPSIYIISCTLWYTLVVDCFVFVLRRWESLCLRPVLLSLRCGFFGFPKINAFKVDTWKALGTIPLDVGSFDAVDPKKEAPLRWERVLFCLSSRSSSGRLTHGSQPPQSCSNQCWLGWCFFSKPGWFQRVYRCSIHDGPFVPGMSIK